VVLSPQLQQALFLGMARELGWLDSESRAEPDGVALEHSRGTNQFPVDFVDLRPRTNFVPSPLTKAELEKQAEESAIQPPAGASVPNIPAFVSGDSLIVAVDSTIAPSGSQLSFSTRGNVQAPLGTAILGSNPLVVTLPLSTVAGNGGSVIINVNNAGGQSQIQFVAPVAGP
jgi:hypothetical protein